VLVRLLGPGGPDLRAFYLPGLEGLKAQLRMLEWLMERAMGRLKEHLEARACSGYGRVGRRRRAARRARAPGAPARRRAACRRGGCPASRFGGLRGQEHGRARLPEARGRRVARARARPGHGAQASDARSCRQGVDQHSSTGCARTSWAQPAAHPTDNPARCAAGEVPRLRAGRAAASSRGSPGAAAGAPHLARGSAARAQPAGADACLGRPVAAQAYSALPVLYASQWLLTCFACPFSSAVACRVIDALLIENRPHCLLRVALALLAELEPELLALDDFEELITCIKAWPCVRR